MEGIYGVRYWLTTTEYLSTLVVLYHWALQHTINIPALAVSAEELQ